MQWTSLDYSTTDNVSRVFRDRQGYIWLYKWDGSDRILRSTVPNGTTFSQVGTTGLVSTNFIDDSHNRVFFTIQVSYPSPNIYYWNGSTIGAFGSSRAASLTIGADDTIYIVDGTELKRCLYGSTSFATISNSVPHGGDPVFIDQDNNIYVSVGSEKKIYKFTIGGSWVDIGADALEWSKMAGGSDNRKYTRCPENNYFYRALSGSDEFSQYSEFDDMSGSDEDFSVDFWGNIFKTRWDAHIDNKARIYTLKYGVTYNANDADSGSAPVNANLYYAHDGFTAAANSGSLVKAGFEFAGWNTAADGSGTRYAPGATITMTADDLTLYAEWTEDEYSVTYNGNGNTGGSVPTDATGYHYTDAATLLTNSGSLLRTGYRFTGWNTSATGGGTHFDPYDIITMTADITLYAEWSTASSIDWPSTDFPTIPLQDGYLVEADNGTISTTVGQEKLYQRRRATAMPKKLTLKYHLTATQKAALDTFYVTTAYGGSKRFNWTDPITTKVLIARFISAPSYVEAGPEFIATVRQETLP